MRLFERKNYKIFFKSKGEPILWLTGGGLMVSLIMIFFLLYLVIKNGFLNFWPLDITHFELKNGEKLMGEITQVQEYKFPEDKLSSLNEEDIKRIQANNGLEKRYLLRIGNFEITNEHFKWVSQNEIAKTTHPKDAVIIERVEWGRFYGFPLEFLIDGGTVASNENEIWALFKKHYPKTRTLWREKVKVEKDDIGRHNHEVEKERLKLKKAQMDFEKAKFSKNPEKIKRAESRLKIVESEFEKFSAKSNEEYQNLVDKVANLKSSYEKYSIRFKTSSGQVKDVKLYEMVRIYNANQLNFMGRLKIYFSRWAEFLLDDPREANSEGGVFPAIFGTVVMTLIMSIFVVPFGVIASIYMKEYAKSGYLLSTLRIAINNLAGVPSIVFGVFGLGFFAYTLGARIDELFYSAKLPNPTFGTGGILWSSLTLALLTLPVVIVATEEAINAVPNSLREGSYACGATKWQTIRYIVIPRALPGIMTGFILAMSRGAGEVAPLMLVGAVKLAPEMPIDGIFPFVHLERSFMHLGFHIYDLGFQSQNSDASIPMVYTTTLLLIVIVVALNMTAIFIRSRLRKKFIGSTF